LINLNSISQVARGADERRKARYRGGQAGVALKLDKALSHTVFVIGGVSLIHQIGVIFTAEAPWYGWCFTAKLSFLVPSIRNDQ